MSQLIVLSNRVSLPDAQAEAGGLGVALSEALKTRGGTWIGWSGAITDSKEVYAHSKNNVHYLTMDMDQKDYDEFYIGYCNSMLWPLCHYRLDLCQFTEEMYASYERVNRRYASLIAKISKVGDLIWVHDYHLMTVGSHLRSLGVMERSGFFLHIPFPTPEVFSALPHSHEMLKYLAAYDVVGFQTDSDLQSFLRCMVEMGEGKSTHMIHENMYEVIAFGRTFRAGCFSISIDTNDLMLNANAADLDPETKKLQESLGDRQMLIGVDRLDYTKGLIERLDAYQHFLEKWPEYRNNVTYVQITPPSRVDVRDYNKIRKNLEERAARINGENSEIDWVPLRYINRSFNRKELAGFYRAARVGLVTPLRDGMNLVAKEYVAAQNQENPGVLVLSQFAGAADELECGALMINPYDKGGMAAQIHRALTMPLSERKRRYQCMISVLKHGDIFLWTRNFLAALQGYENTINLGKQTRGRRTSKQVALPGGSISWLH